MLKISDISEKHGLSKRQVRYRLTQLDNLLESHVSTGKNQAKLVDDYGVSLFGRLMELEKDGHNTAAAVNKIENEIEDNEEFEEEREACKNSVKVRESVVEQLEARIEDLRQHNRELREQLDRKDEQLQQLLPAAQEKEKPEASPWKLFKNWLFKPQ